MLAGNNDERLDTMKFSLWHLAVLVTLVAVAIRLRRSVETCVWLYAVMAVIMVSATWYCRSPTSPIWLFGRLSARYYLSLIHI